MAKKHREFRVTDDRNVDVICGSVLNESIWKIFEERPRIWIVGIFNEIEILTIVFFEEDVKHVLYDVTALVVGIGSQANNRDGWCVERSELGPTFNR